MINFELTEEQSKKMLSIISQDNKNDTLFEELRLQYKEQYVEPIKEEVVEIKPTALYHSINSAKNTYFEYNPKKVMTALCQEKTRQWLPNFKNNYFANSGRIKMASLNAMLFSYRDYSTGAKTNNCILFGTAMRDMGIWINKPYINDYVINMICTVNDQLIIQDGVKEDEYKKAKFIISGYACTKDGRKDYRKHSKTPHLAGKTNRTIYGQKDNGNMVMITLKSATANDCQNLCIAMGVTNSIMLDGGGSTRFNLFGKRMSLFNGYRKIANALILYSNLKDRTEVEYSGRQYIKY